MKDQDHALRELTGHLFGKEQETPAAQSAVSAEPVTGPVIPGQDKHPDLNQRLTPTQRWANRLFNAGTAREHY